MRLIIYAIAAYIFYTLVKRTLFPPGRGRSTGPTATQGGGSGNGGEYSGAQETVQDPVCKTFIIKDSALSHRDGRGTHYFCSEDCRGKYKDGG